MSSRNWMRLILFAFLVRYAFALLPSFQVDMGAWLAWAHRLSTLGPASFYSDSVWTQYTPGFLYWLLIIGKLGWVHPLAIKIPVITLDILCGYLLSELVSRKNIKTRIFVFLFYVLNPMAIIDGSIWGQIDGVLSLFMFLAAYYLIEKKNIYFSYVMAAVAFLIKPQTIAILPVLAIVGWQRYGLKKTLLSIMIGVLVALAAFIPFYPNQVFGGIYELIQKMSESYPYTSLFAFNMWGYIGMWIPDSTKWLNVSYFGIGSIVSATLYLFMIVRYRKYLIKGSEVYLLLGIACYIFFLFPTRVHERYLFPAFSFLLAYAASAKSKSLFVLICGMILVYSINLYYPYSYYEAVTNPLKNTAIEAAIAGAIPMISMIQIAFFGGLWLFPARKNTKESIPVLLGHREKIKHGEDKQKTNESKA